MKKQQKRMKTEKKSHKWECKEENQPLNCSWVVVKLLSSCDFIYVLEETGEKGLLVLDIMIKL